MAAIKAGHYHTSHGQDTECLKRHLIQIQHITIGCRSEVKMEHASKDSGGCCSETLWQFQVQSTGHGNLVQYCGEGELGKESRGENVAIPR